MVRIEGHGVQGSVEVRTGVGCGRALERVRIIFSHVWFLCLGSAIKYGFGMILGVTIFL